MARLRIITILILLLQSNSKSQNDSLIDYKLKYLDLIPGKKYKYYTRYNTANEQILKRTDSTFLVFYLENGTDSIRLNKRDLTRVEPSHNISGSGKKIKIRNIKKYYSIHHVLTENALSYDSIYGGGFHLHSFILNNVHAKLSDQWSLHSYFLVFLPMSLGVRYGKNIFDNHYIGANMNVFYSRDDSLRRYIFPAFGNLSVRYTIGNLNRHLTLGAVCFAFRREFLMNFNSNRYGNMTALFKLNPGLYAGYTGRFSNSWVLNLEALYFTQSWGYVGTGIRYINRRNNSIQLALLSFYNATVFAHGPGKLRVTPVFLLPYISFCSFPFK